MATSIANCNWKSAAVCLFIFIWSLSCWTSFAATMEGGTKERGTTAKEGNGCIQETSCRCRFPSNGSVVDLSSLAGTSHQRPRFNITDNSTGELFSYMYNPCFNFTIPESQTNCSNVAACRSHKGILFRSLGSQKSAKFNVNGSRLEIQYRNVSVTLECNPSSDNPMLKIRTVTNISLSLTLTSKCACPNGCVEAKADVGGISPGGVILIIFCTGLLVYLVGGVLYRKFGRGATGIETIPNFAFWMDFPLLVRDGIVFVFNGCKVDASYDRI